MDTRCDRLSSARLALRLFALAVLVLSLPLIVPIEALAVSLLPNDIVASVNVGTRSHVDPGLMLIDPATGSRTIISDDAVGTGPSFVPTPPVGDTIGSILMPSVSLQADGSLLVTVEGEMIPSAGPIINFGSIFRVDPATGDRTIVSDLSANSGPSSFYYGAREAGASILLSGSAGLLSVNPTTGDRSLFSGAGLGTGPAITQSSGFIQSGNTLYVADDVGNQIMKIDATTGNRSVVSSASFGTGPALNGPAGIAFDSAGDLIVSTSSGAIVRVNIASGDRAILSSSTVGTGPGPSIIGEIGIASNGTIVGADYADNSILLIDPNTGNRSVLSDATHGAGPALLQPFSVTVVPSVPEPSAYILILLGAASLLAESWRRNRRLSGRAR
jgi:hypothetical protein